MRDAAPPGLERAWRASWPQLRSLEATVRLGGVGREIARCLGLPESAVTAVSVRDVPMRAARPQYAALDNSKLAAAGFLMPSWQDAIRRYLSGRA